jgi:REP element-mobilizing transposase RayT
MSLYHRRLPHWQPDGKSLFVTWRLHGSIPPHRYVFPQDLTGGQAFVWMDRYLDQARYGPCWLRQEKVAQLVSDAIRYGARELLHYQLDADAIMPNHVHILLLPLVAPSKLFHSLKGFSAREANLVLGRTGEPFWQKESYDHRVRDEREWGRIKAYIEDNPVKSGLAARPQDYRWSSAFQETQTESRLESRLASRTACPTP